MAAGVTWTSRTTSAPWPGGYRYYHTSVIDATGTIYVIGGLTHSGGGSSTYHQDVWASTNGGAHQMSV